MLQNIKLKIEVLLVFFISILNTSCDFQSFSTDDSTLTKNYSDTVKCIAFDKKSNIWLGSSSGGISRYNKKKLTVFDERNGFISNTVNSIEVDINDVVWVGTDKGVCKYDGTNWINYTITDGLICNQTNDIAIDNQNNIWIATSSGISKFDGKNWNNYSTSTGLLNNYITCVCIDLNNNKWFGTWGGGVSVLNDTTWYTMTINDGLSSNYIKSLVASPSGKLLYGTDIDGIIACAFDSKGKGWFGGENKGVSTVVGNKITTYFKDYYIEKTTQSNGLLTTATQQGQTGLSGNSIYDIKIDSQGNIWVGTDCGISMFNGSKWTSSFSVEYQF